MSQSNETPSPEEEKRPFQFSLRTMFVVTTIWGVLCAIWATFGLAPAFFAAGVCTSIPGIFVYLDGREKLGRRMIGLGLLSMYFSGFVMPSAPVSARESARRASCINKLKQIGLALHAYEDDYGSFPPAYIADASGKPMHSWRVLLLPYLDRNDIYDKYSFDEPWDGPNNSKLHGIMVSYYKCPTDYSATSRDTDTSYVAVVGPNTMFPGEESVKLEDIPDGPSATITLVEIFNSGIHWMEPRDLNIEEMAPTINWTDPQAQGTAQMLPVANLPTGQGISSGHPNVANVLFGDGAVHTLTEDQLTPEQIQALLTRNGGEEVDVDSLQR